MSSTGKITGFRLCPEIVYDNQQKRYLLIGFIGENSQQNLDDLRNRTRF